LQFTLAILVVLVPDNYADAHIGSALHRLLSIFVGIAVLEPVLLIWHLLARVTGGLARESEPGHGNAPGSE
jgi:hypothetical protein